MKNSSKISWALGAVIIILLVAVLVRIPAKKVSTARGLSPKWAKLELVLQQIEDNYVDAVDPAELTEKILPYLMSSLDPHSVYLEPEQLKSADDQLQGNIEGIGVVFNMPNDTATVISVVLGGPSDKLGVQSGDKIVTINDETVAGVQIQQDSIVSRLKGPKGSSVKVGIKRFGSSDLLYFDIVRDKVPVNSVDVAYMITPDIGYLKLSKFARTSYMEILQIVSDLLDQGMKKMIFDLRDNTGGYMDQAFRISEAFLEKGKLIVYTEGAHRKREDYYNQQDGFLRNMPLALLINEQSASSSEILAGALQDNDRGTIIGRRSYGKGLVQEPIYFSDKSGVRLTVMRYYTPLGRSIQKPYADDYGYDLLERYNHGEFMQADSIPKNDSLRFVTPKGKVLYGGGGIIPDVFVPLDTVGMNDCYMDISRKNLQVLFGIQYADRHRQELVAIDAYQGMEDFFAKRPLEKEFLSYAAANKVTVDSRQWQACKHIIMTQVKAYVARYSNLEEAGMYSYLNQLDNVTQKAISLLDQEE